MDGRQTHPCGQAVSAPLRSEALLFKVWSLAQQPSITWELSRNVKSHPDLLKQNLHGNNISIGFTGTFTFAKCWPKVRDLVVGSCPCLGTASEG